MPDEDHTTLGDMARRANQGVVLAATDTRRVGDDAGQDQLVATRCTTHHNTLRPGAHLRDRSDSPGCYARCANSGLTAVGLLPASPARAQRAAQRTENELKGRGRALMHAASLK